MQMRGALFRSSKAAASAVANSTSTAAAVAQHHHRSSHSHSHAAARQTNRNRNGKQQPSQQHANGNAYGYNPNSYLNRAMASTAVPPATAAVDPNGELAMPHPHPTTAATGAGVNSVWTGSHPALVASANKPEANAKPAVATATTTTTATVAASDASKSDATAAAAATLSPFQAQLEEYKQRAIAAREAAAAAAAAAAAGGEASASATAAPTAVAASSVAAPATTQTIRLLTPHPVVSLPFRSPNKKNKRGGGGGANGQQKGGNNSSSSGAGGAGSNGGATAAAMTAGAYRHGMSLALAASSHHMHQLMNATAAQAAAVATTQQTNSFDTATATSDHSSSPESVASAVITTSPLHAPSYPNAGGGASSDADTMSTAGSDADYYASPVLMPVPVPASASTLSATVSSFFPSTASTSSGMSSPAYSSASMASSRTASPIPLLAQLSNARALSPPPQSLSQPAFDISGPVPPSVLSSFSFLFGPDTPPPASTASASGNASTGSRPSSPPLNAGGDNGLSSSVVASFGAWTPPPPPASVAGSKFANFDFFTPSPQPLYQAASPAGAYQPPIVATASGGSGAVLTFPRATSPTLLGGGGIGRRPTAFVSASAASSSAFGGAFVLNSVPNRMFSTAAAGGTRMAGSPPLSAYRLFERHMQTDVRRAPSPQPQQRQSPQPQRSSSPSSSSGGRGKRQPGEPPRQTQRPSQQQQSQTPRRNNSASPTRQQQPHATAVRHSTPPPPVRSSARPASPPANSNAANGLPNPLSLFAKPPPAPIQRRSSTDNTASSNAETRKRTIAAIAAAPIGGAQTLDVAAALSAALRSMPGATTVSAAAAVTTTTTTTVTPVSGADVKSLSELSATVVSPAVAEPTPEPVDDPSLSFLRSRDLITTTEQFRTLLSTLANVTTPVGVDTEFITFQTYRPQLELVQIGFRNPNARAPAAGVSASSEYEHISAYAIDARALRKELPQLVAALSDKECVYHGCTADLEVMSFAASNAEGSVTNPAAFRTPPLPKVVFDTQIAAGFIGLGARMAYGKLVRELLGVSLDKGQTMSDWSRRPLSDTQLSYALNDVRYLPALRDVMTARLAKNEREPIFREEMKVKVEGISESIQDLNEADAISNQLSLAARSTATAATAAAAGTTTTSTVVTAAAAAAVVPDASTPAGTAAIAASAEGAFGARAHRQLWTRVRRWRSLDRIHSLPILREIVAWRERTALEMNKNPFFVLTDAQCHAISAMRIRSLAELSTIQNIKPLILNMYGPQIVAVVQAGIKQSLAMATAASASAAATTGAGAAAASEQPDWEELLIPDEDIERTERGSLYGLLQAWTAAVSAQTGIAPELLSSSDDLRLITALSDQQIQFIATTAAPPVSSAAAATNGDSKSDAAAPAAPPIAVLSGWRRQVIGNDLLAIRSGKALAWDPTEAKTKLFTATAMA